MCFFKKKNKKEELVTLKKVESLLGEGESRKTVTAVTIPEDIQVLDYRAFGDCYALTSIVIPDGVRRIKVSAFERCKSLTSVTLGSGLVKIGSLVFLDCKALSEIRYNGTKEQWEKVIKKYDWLGGKKKSVKQVRCLDGSVEL